MKMPERLPSQITDRFIDYIRGTGDMMIHLELRFENRINAERLEKALRLALETVPVLGCRFVRRSWKPYWERLSGDTRSSFFFTEDTRDYDSFKSRSIDAHSGPQVNICLLDTSGDTRLLLKVTHMAADAAGVKEVARIISSIYSRLKDDPDYIPEPYTSGSRSMGQIFSSIPFRHYPGLFSRFFKDSKASRDPQDVLTIPTGGDSSNLPVFVEHTIPADRSGIIFDYAHKYGATLNDMMLTAFFRALAATQDWNGGKHLKATTTIDLRQYVTGESVSSVANLSIPIWGWPDLKNDLGDDFLSTLERISGITRERKRNYLGVETLLGILLFLGGAPHSWSSKLVGNGIRDKISEGNFASAYTNMGLIAPETVVFDVKPVEARLLPPPVYPPWFMLGISSYESVISLSAGVYSGQNEYVERFLGAMDAELPG